jgi:WD40 repeat protein
VNGGIKKEKVGKEESFVSRVAAFSPQGSYLITDGNLDDPWLYRLRENDTGGPSIRSIELVAPDNRPSDRRYRYLDIWTRDGQWRGQIPYRKEGVPDRISFAPDGSVFAVRLYERGSLVFDSLGQFHSLLNQLLNRPKTVIFSEDNRYALATYGNNTARIVDRRGRASVVLDQHQGTVTSAQFDPSGKSVLTITGTSAKLFTLEGQLLADFNRHDGPIQSAYFTADGRYVVTLDSEGTIRRYPLPSRIYAWLNSEGLLPGLTKEERKSYGLLEF